MMPSPTSNTWNRRPRLRKAIRNAIVSIPLELFTAHEVVGWFDTLKPRRKSPPDIHRVRQEMRVMENDGLVESVGRAAPIHRVLMNDLSDGYVSGLPKALLYRKTCGLCHVCDEIISENMLTGSEEAPECLSCFDEDPPEVV